MPDSIAALVADLERLRFELVRERSTFGPDRNEQDLHAAMEAFCVAAYADLPQLIAALKAQAKIISEVEDVLTVNWIVAKDGGYRTALHELVTRSIQEHDDPAISEVAAKREAALKAALAERDEARRLFRMARKRLFDEFGVEITDEWIEEVKAGRSDVPFGLNPRKE